MPVVRSGDSGNRAPPSAVARAADLKRLLEEHNRRYYVDDAPTISDAEYDALFRELLELAGPLGLYAEEMDPATRQHLGNYPQALTHAALVQAAIALRVADTGPFVDARGAAPTADGAS